MIQVNFHTLYSSSFWQDRDLINPSGMLIYIHYSTFTVSRDCCLKYVKNNDYNQICVSLMPVVNVGWGVGLGVD